MNAKKIRLRRKKKMRNLSRDKTQYCWFHGDHGYDTNDYHTLKDEIEFLIRRGYLKPYTRLECNSLVLLKGIRDEYFKWSFSKNRPKTIRKLKL